MVVGGGRQEGIGGGPGGDGGGVMLMWASELWRGA